MDGANLVQNDTGSSAIDNGYYGDPNNDCGVTYPTQGASVSLTIKSGEFSGGMNTVKNDDFGVLTIDGRCVHEHRWPCRVELERSDHQRRYLYCQ